MEEMIMEINRRDFISSVGVAGLGLLTGCRTGKAAKKRPNVVFVLTDQWRASAAGYAGDPNVKTPHLDALAAESIHFKNAVSCCPVCSPARASIITGQYPLTHGVFVNDVYLQHKTPSLADCFNAAGYRTGFIGKWHLDGHGRKTYIPPERRQGFQYWKALECSHDYNHSEYYDNNNPDIKTWDGYDVYAQTEDAIDFIRRSEGSPFLLLLSWGPPHDPYMTAPPDLLKQYDPSSLHLRPNVPRDEADLVPRTRWEEKAATPLETPALIASGYYAHCAAMDRCVGQLQDAIRSAGLEEDTIFIFTSDHGDMLGSHGQWNKQQPYDESARVPFLLKFPRFGPETKSKVLFGNPKRSEAAKTGRTVNAPINSPDILPTLCDLCGIPAPSTAEGESFADRLFDNPRNDDAALIASYHPFGQWEARRGGKEWRGVRTARYTYVRDLNGPWLLFDNETDPYQMNNRVNRPEHAALQADLEARLQEKLRQTGDEFLPGMDYIRRWNYKVNEFGTVQYSQ
jgi:arylsulfatase A-like enzyme